MMQVTLEAQEKTFAVVTVEGEVDALTASDLDAALSDLLHQGYIRLALDFSKVRFISSAGLGTVLRVQQEASKLGGQIRLFELRDNVRRVFEIAGFDRIIPILAERPEAIEGW
jgi:anti-sigma B factor antagonist